VVKVPRPDRACDIYFAKDEAPDVFPKALFALRAQKTFIHPLELLGILAPYVCPELAEIWRDADVIHFGDNEAANGASIKGTSGARDLSRLALILHTRLAASATRIWIEWVCSAGNIADDPSRDEIGSLLAMGAKQIHFVFPDLLAKVGL
jgi:hypothetical protein